MKLPVFFCLIAAITFAINANAGRRASTPNSQVDGFFLRLYLPSLANENGEPNQFYIYKIIPSRSYLFEPEFINDDPSHFVPYTFLNKADFISFFNPKKPNKTVFRIVMGEDAVVLGRFADLSMLRPLVNEPYFEGEIRVWKNGHILLRVSDDDYLDPHSLNKAKIFAASFFNYFGFTITVSNPI